MVPAGLAGPAFSNDAVSMSHHAAHVWVVSGMSPRSLSQLERARHQACVDFGLTLRLSHGSDQTQTEGDDCESNPGNRYQSHRAQDAAQVQHQRERRH